MSARAFDGDVPPAGAGPARQRFVLWPERSLGTCGMFALLATAAAGLIVPVAVIAGTTAWPLLLPAGATFAGLALALWRNCAAARICEIIDITPRAIRIERIGSGNASARASFDPHWARLTVSSDRYVQNRITFVESGRSWSVGGFLAPEEREHLAAALREKLSAIRNG